jgi:ADP-L-glycero-D-manno-heptose 6-epimerase
MNIVTGAKGFIGNHFACTVDKPLEVDIDNCFELLNKFNRWKDVDMIIHMGALSSTVNKDVDAIYKYNIDYSIKLFEKAIEYGIPVKYASSASTYGRTNDIINPLNYYAMSKATVDYWVQDNMHRFSHIQGFKFFNVYGFGEVNKGEQASLVSKFQWQSATGAIHPFQGSEKVLRDYIWVGDIVNVVLTNSAGSGIFDLGTGKSMSIQHVADLVAQKNEARVEEIPFPPNLVGKYQYNTQADMSWLSNYNFRTVDDYINHPDPSIASLDPY